MSTSCTETEVRKLLGVVLSAMTMPLPGVTENWPPAVPQSPPMSAVPHALLSVRLKLSQAMTEVGHGTTVAGVDPIAVAWTLLNATRLLPLLMYPRTPMLPAACSAALSSRPMSFQLLGSDVP